MKFFYILLLLITNIVSVLKKDRIKKQLKSTWLNRLLRENPTQNILHKYLKKNEFKSKTNIHEHVLPYINQDNIFSYIIYKGDFYHNIILFNTAIWKRFIEYESKVQPVAQVFYLRTLMNFLGKNIFVKNKKEFHYLIGNFCDTLNAASLLKIKEKKMVAMIMTKIIKKYQNVYGKIDLSVVLRKFREDKINLVQSSSNLKNFYQKSKLIKNTFNINIPKFLSRYLDYQPYFEKYTSMAKSYITSITSESNGFKKFNSEMMKFQMRWQPLQFPRIKSIAKVSKINKYLELNSSSQNKSLSHYSKYKEKGFEVELQENFIKIFLEIFKNQKFNSFKQIHKTYGKFVDFINSYLKLLPPKKIKVFSDIVQNKKSQIGLKFHQSFHRLKNFYLVRANQEKSEAIIKNYKKQNLSKTSSLNQNFDKTSILQFQKPDDNYQLTSEQEFKHFYHKKLTNNILQSFHRQKNFRLKKIDQENSLALHKMFKKMNKKQQKQFTNFISKQKQFIFEQNIQNDIIRSIYQMLKKPKNRQQEYLKSHLSRIKDKIIRKIKTNIPFSFRTILKKQKEQQKYSESLMQYSKIQELILAFPIYQKLFSIFNKKMKSSYFRNYQEFQQSYSRYIEKYHKIIPNPNGLSFHFLKQFPKKTFFQNNQYFIDKQLDSIHLPNKRRDYENVMSFIKQQKQSKILSKKTIKNILNKMTEFPILRCHQHSYLTYNKIIQVGLDNFDKIQNEDQYQKFKLAALTNDKKLEFSFKTSYMYTSKFLQQFIPNLFTSKILFKRQTNKQMIDFNIDSINSNNQKHIKLVGQMMMSAVHLNKVYMMQKIGYSKSIKQNQNDKKTYKVGDNQQKSFISKFYLKNLNSNKFLQFYKHLQNFMSVKSKIQQEIFSSLSGSLQSKIFFHEKSNLKKLENKKSNHLQNHKKQKLIDERFKNQIESIIHLKNLGTHQLLKYKKLQSVINQNFQKTKILRKIQNEIESKILLKKKYLLNLQKFLKIQNNNQQFTKSIQNYNKNGLSKIIFNKNKQELITKYQKHFSNMMKSISQVQTSQLRKILIRKYLSSLDSQLKYSYYLFKPFFGHTITKQDFNEMNSILLLRKQDIGEIKKLKYSDTKTLYQDIFQTIKKNNILSKINFLDKPLESQRIAGKDDAFNLYKQIYPKELKKAKTWKDVGVLRINPIDLQRQAVVICCSCGCEEKCCSDEDQSNLQFVKDVSQVINLNPKVVMNLYEKNSKGKLSKKYTIDFTLENNHLIKNDHQDNNVKKLTNLNDQNDSINEDKVEQLNSQTQSLISTLNNLDEQNIYSSNMNSIKINSNFNIDYPENDDDIKNYFSKKIIPQKKNEKQTNEIINEEKQDQSSNNFIDEDSIESIFMKDESFKGKSQNPQITNDEDQIKISLGDDEYLLPQKFITKVEKQSNSKKIKKQSILKEFKQKHKSTSNTQQIQILDNNSLLSDVYDKLNFI